MEERQKEGMKEWKKYDGIKEESMNEQSEEERGRKAR